MNSLANELQELLAEQGATAAPSSQPSQRPARRQPVRRIRNYKAMRNDKLVTVIHELRYRGEAYYRSLDQGSGDPSGDLDLCLTLAAERGLEV